MADQLGTGATGAGADQVEDDDQTGERGHVRHGEGVFVGYRGRDALHHEVSYPFGHGLSYTTFAYADLSAEVHGRAEDGDLAIPVRCRITNTGGRRGKEVIQVYVAGSAASVARPVRELKAFTLQEWLADPDLLVKAVGIDETGRPNGILGDEHRIRVIGNFPLNRVPAFTGLAVTHEVVRAVSEQIAQIRP